LETKLLGRFEHFKHEKILLIASNIKYWNFAIIIATLASGLFAGQERSLGVMPHAPKSARECEGIDPHTLKGTPTLGVGVPMDS
jgi:hypothetical protein